MCFAFTEESEEVGLHVIKEVYDVLKKVKTLDQECDIRNRVEKVDETVIDSSILSSASKVVTNCINALQVSESNYDPIEFAKKLVSLIDFYLIFHCHLNVFNR